METETENLNSQNEEQETTDSPNGEEVTEEAATEQSEDTTEEPKEPEYTENEKKLFARAKKAEEELKKLKGDKPEKKEPASDDKYTRLELKTEGIKDSEDIDYVIRAAKNEGLEPLEALKLDFVQDRLKDNERKRNSANATPRSNNRANNQQDEVDLWVRKYKKDGSLPENNPALTSKILDKLSTGA